MGFRKPMDYTSIHHQVYTAGVELHSPYNDGYNQWIIKQDLYRLKWLIDEIINQSSEFSGEKEFLEEHSKVKMWRTLNR